MYHTYKKSRNALAINVTLASKSWLVWKVDRVADSAADTRTRQCAKLGRGLIRTRTQRIARSGHGPDCVRIAMACLPRLWKPSRCSAVPRTPCARCARSIQSSTGPNLVHLFAAMVGTLLLNMTISAVEVNRAIVVFLPPGQQAWPPQWCVTLGDHQAPFHTAKNSSKRCRKAARARPRLKSAPVSPSDSESSKAEALTPWRAS